MGYHSSDSVKWPGHVWQRASSPLGRGLSFWKQNKVGFPCFHFRKEKWYAHCTDAFPWTSFFGVQIGIILNVITQKRSWGCNIDVWRKIEWCYSAKNISLIDSPPLHLPVAASWKIFTTRGNTPFLPNGRKNQKKVNMFVACYLHYCHTTGWIVFSWMALVSAITMI